MNKLISVAEAIRLGIIDTNTNLLNHGVLVENGVIVFPNTDDRNVGSEVEVTEDIDGLYLGKTLLSSCQLLEVTTKTHPKRKNHSFEFVHTTEAYINTYKDVDNV